ncbi:hypothetical protein JIN85_03290 [Luteolibacter pohnpeiensis]|uniref:Secreted protein n=1 Tax=Luteolibacter pohnpeiensis TaxID=454153 RepID=A0A934S8Q5_9BACT|nr:hypothetical protein [Luteolibacter pohnpeiensis]MBK1881424.1 hypothetical protein [Luteolibacter pohnpeiensis]
MKALFVGLLLILNCLGCEADAAKISFSKTPNGDCECTIVGDGIVLSDPSRSYFDLIHVNTEGRKNYLPIRNNRTKMHWKFLIILLRNREDSPSLNSYKFIISKKDFMDANHPVSGDFKPVGLRLFWCDYESFEKNGLSAMKLRDFSQIQDK